MKYKLFGSTALVFALLIGALCVAKGPSVARVWGQDHSQYGAQNSCCLQKGGCNAEQRLTELLVIEDALATFVAPAGEGKVMR